MTPVADRLHDAGGLVAEQEREVVVDAALAVVQVGVADPAGLHLHHRLAGAGVGDVDRLDGRPAAPLPRAMTPLTCCMWCSFSGRLSGGACQPAGQLATGRRRRRRRRTCNPAPRVRVLVATGWRDDDAHHRRHGGRSRGQADEPGTPTSRRTSARASPRLLRTAYLLTGDRASAEDLLQNSLAKLYLSWDRVPRRELGRRLPAPDHGQREQLLWRRPWKRREVAVDRGAGDRLPSPTSTTRAGRPAVELRADAAPPGSAR